VDGIVRPDVRRCGDQPHVAGRGDARQVERRLDVGRAVVDAGKDVAVHIDEPRLPSAVPALGHRCSWMPARAAVKPNVHAVHGPHATG
jgi:hypothetical protein